MAKNVTVYSVLVASPSDVSQEREIVSAVISELNESIADLLQCRLECIKWETHAKPGISDYPQKVINEQILDHYDIFLGILWQKFGTPTKIAESGTMEEFHDALTKFNKGENIDILFYFNDAPPASISSINVEEIGKVQKFRESLSEIGVLYFSYRDQEEFRHFVSTHLVNSIKKLQTTKLPEKALIGLPADISESIEKGLLDFESDFMDAVTDITACMERMSSSTVDMSNAMAARTEEINSLSSPDIHERKRVIIKVSNDLQNYCERMKPDVDLYRRSFSALLENFEQMILAAVELDNQETDAAKTLKAHFEQMLLTMATSKSQTLQFRNTINGLPSIFSTFNVAKNQTVRMLDTLISEFAKGINVGNDILKNPLIF